MRSESAVSNLSIEGRPILLSSNQEHVSRAAQANKNHDARPVNYTQQQQEQNQSTQIAEIVPSVISSDSEDEKIDIQTTDHVEYSDVNFLLVLRGSVYFWISFYRTVNQNQYFTGTKWF